MMKSFLAFGLFGCINAQNSTQSLRSLLSPRDGVILSDAPKIEGTYCGWSQHGESIHCRLDFKDGKMRLAYKRKGDGKKHDGCKDGKGPEHACCRCSKSVDFDCKDISYKVSQGAELTSGLGSDGYDVHFTSSCIESDMGKDDKNSNKVPLRIKIHDSGHMDLLECEQQDSHTCDGGGPRCDVVHNGPDGSGCDDWDGSHTPSCRRRAGCHGPSPSPSPSPSDDRRRRSPSPSPSDDRRRRGGDDRRRRGSPSPSPSTPCRRRSGCHSRGLPVPEAGDDEFEDDLKICSASCSGVEDCSKCEPPDEDFGTEDFDDEPPQYMEFDLDDIEVV